MTYLLLKASLETICQKTYEIEAPAGENRFIVINTYGAVPLFADDAVQMEALKVQLDVFWQAENDTLLADVKGALSALYIPYSVQEIGYDDEYMRMRCILQLEVL